MTSIEDSVSTPARLELVERAAALGPALAARAAEHDRAAEFPHANWADFTEAGLLGLCVPEEHGGLGGDFVAYALVAEELGRHCPATALTFNMHTATALLVGPIADELDVDDDMRSHLDARLPALWDGMVNHGVIHSQPFSEGATPGSNQIFGTIATPVDGGYRVSGRKIFASLSGGAHVHNVVAVVEGDRRLRLLGVPHDDEGITLEGTWDPLGMRGTDSRNLLMDEVFVPDANEVAPPGLFNMMISRYPYFYMTLAFSYLGLMRAILDLTAEYLRGDHGVEARRDNHVKQAGWAEMQMTYESAQAQIYRVLAECGPDPTDAALRRAWVATIAVMEGAPQVASTAIRVCGGRSLLRPHRLEQHYRDARCGATMLPWSVEVLLDRLGRFALYDD